MVSCLIKAFVLEANNRKGAGLGLIPIARRFLRRSCSGIGCTCYLALARFDSIG